MNYGVAEDVEVGNGDAQEKAKEKAQEKTKENCNAIQDKILELIKENPYISRKEIATLLGIHDSSAKRRLASLQERHIICRIGADKGGYWQIL